MAKLVIVRNLTPSRQVRLAGAEPIEWTPYGEQLLTPEQAEDVASQRPGTLEIDEMENVVKTTVPEYRPTTKWIANVTGDPDATDTVPTTEYHTNAMTNKREVVRVANPIKEPRVLSRHDMGEPIIQTTAEGWHEEITTAGVTYVLRPFQRTELPAEKADWFLGREARAAGGLPTAAIESRAPTNFEPDMSWKLDEMRAYLHMIDSDANINISERDVRRAHTNRDEADKAVAAEKIMMLRRVFLRVADPKKVPRLPTKAEFETWFGRYGDKYLGADEAEAPQAKAEADVEETFPAPKPAKRGRPRKNKSA